MKRLRREVTNWERIFANDISDREILSEIIQITIKTQQWENEQPTKKMGKMPKQTPHQKRYAHHE